MTSLVVKGIEVDWSLARQHERKVAAAERNIVSEGAHRLLDAANETVPDDPETRAGDLKASGFVEVNRGTGPEAFVVGYSAPYALRQHEDSSLRHQGSGRWKWLQLTADERARDVGDKMADEAKRRIG